jgi:assimilatory nitrate reductase catalytic subunit
LNIDVSLIPDRPSWSYNEIIEGILRGRIKGLWVVCTNTAHSWINQNTCHDILDRLDFLVVQDMYHTTDTARLADLVLPAAGWGEKDGTFINSERRIGRVRKLRRAPGQALADFHVFRLVAEAWGCGELFREWRTPEDVFRSIRALSAGRPCDLAGIEGYAMLDAEGGVQWPLPAGAPAPARERRLFEDGRFFHPDGRARFVFEAPRPVPEPADADYPFVLLTGRGSSSQWHTQTRTAKSPVLRKLHRAECGVEIHPKDAARLGIAPEEVVRVRSRRGALQAHALVRETVREGELFVAMHDAATNRLTHPSFDPTSRQPSYKHCAVRVERLPNPK